MWAHLEFEYYMRGRKYLWSHPFEGVLENLRRRMVETESDSVRERLSSYLSPHECPVCHGARLNPVSLAVTVGGLSIDRFNALSVGEALKFVTGLELDAEKSVIAAPLVAKDVHSAGLSLLESLAQNFV